jgi:steroid delta-isomerase-like uncharacterized protein
MDGHNIMDEQLDRSKLADQIWMGKADLGKHPVGDHAELVRRFFDEVWNKGNLDAVDQLLSPNYVDHSLPPGAPRGLKGYKAGVTMFRTAFPDIQYTLDQVLVEGDRVALRLTGRGTHKGNFMGIAATGKQVSFGGMTFIRLENGQVVERWGISDMGGLMQQLSPAPGQPPVMAPQPKGQYEHVTVMRPKDSKSTTRVLGIVNLTKAVKEDTRGIYSFFVSTAPPGEGVPIHTHLKEDEAYYILDGTWEIYDTTNQQTLTVGPDDYIYVPMGINHGFKNVGDKPARMILLITPGGLEGFFEGIGQTIEDLDHLPPPVPFNPADFAKAAQVAARYNITFVAPERDGAK